MITAEEIKNGWTEETLKEYLSEREQASQKMIFRPKKPPIRQVGYSPHRWRR